MVRSVEVIRQELKALDETTATLADEFDRLYEGYLDVLGRAVRQQVMIATYHLCTQVYPEAFLGLSVNQREQLQKQIRQLGQEGQQWLQDIMEAQDSEPQSFEDLPAEQQARISRLTAALEAIPMDEDNGELAPDGDSESASPASENGVETPPTSIQFIAVDSSDEEPELSTPPPLEAQETDSEAPASSTSANDDRTSEVKDLSEVNPEATPDSAASGALSTQKMDPKSLIQSVIMAAMADDAQETLQGRPFTGENLTPTLLAKHHLILEQRIRQVLHRISKRANQHLKQAHVIPDLPEAVLDAAAEAETGPEKGRSMPNLLNVLVEMAADMENEEDSDATDQQEDEPDNEEELESDEDTMRGMMTHLSAVNLRLSDLEFSDVQSSVGRSKLRTALGKLRKLGKQYQRTQRELAIAEAEQAWRAVWYDDSSD
jgi:hypothetical protein